MTLKSKITKIEDFIKITSGPEVPEDVQEAFQERSEIVQEMRETKSKQLLNELRNRLGLNSQKIGRFWGRFPMPSDLAIRLQNALTRGKNKGDLSCR